MIYHYPDGQKAIDDINFTITHGESVALVGANGAGKSTLLLHINGTIIPRQGIVNIGNIPVNEKTPEIIRKKVEIVFQNSDDQLFMPTVFDDVAFGPVNLNIPAEDVRFLVDHALEQVGALHSKDHPPYKLSAGEKRLVAIATVLPVFPEILVMDEPTSDLDPFSRRTIIQLLKSFHHTKIIATHDLDMTMELCERTIILNKGEISSDGPTEVLFNDNKLLAASHLEQPLCMQSCPVCGKAG
ncbi:MAG: ABC transporter ATP-binding protein [Spirochaetales bacterium]|nr:ABC transporter ATP-binding protein [Spirochaetales bacterium]